MGFMSAFFALAVLPLHELCGRLSKASQSYSRNWQDQGNHAQAGGMSEKDRIRWRSRRGVLELDLVLERFLAGQFNALTQDELEVYKDLLLLPDNDLLDLVNGKLDLQDVDQQAMVHKLRAC
jgi:antitoxin CptB